jgi:hypothetical protein
VLGEARAEPERTCIGCRTSAPKHWLIRIARDPDGDSLAVGPSAGRGAYVHRDAECIARATRPAVLARALREGLAPNEVGRLRERIEGELENA